MTRKIIFALLCLCAIGSKAQVRFGYLSYQSIINMMPEYKHTAKNLEILRNESNKEVKKTEDELMRKYAEFLQGQKDFPENILQKRQNELQLLIHNSISFRQETEKLMKDAEKDMKREVENKLNQAIEAIGQEYGLAFVLNTDNHSCPFINKTQGINITQGVLVKLGLARPNPIAVPELVMPISENNQQAPADSLQNNISLTDAMMQTDSLQADTTSLREIITNTTDSIQ